MRAPRESAGVDFRLDACPRQRRQRGAGRQVAASVVRADRLARGDRHIGERRRASRRRRCPSKSRLAGANRAVPAALARLNGVMSQQFAGLATSPVPVLVPFDVDALLRDQAAGADAVDAERYLSGFHAATFFYPGPAGYDAAFAIRTSEVPELSDIKFADPIEVQISGSALLYDLDAPDRESRASRCASLEEEFPGIRRMILEHHLRYTFVRFGVPYVVSVDLLRRRRLALQDADLQGRRSGRAALPACVARGRRHAADASAPQSRCRSSGPTRVSHSFGYYGPGQLLSGTGFRGQGGRVGLHGLFADPLSARGRAGLRQFAGVPAPQTGRTPPSRTMRSASAMPWRDNFCERRGFPVGQCPAGIGHQGQDIRPGTVQAAARHGALHPSWRHRRRSRRRHPALATAGGRLSVRQLGERAHPVSLPAHEPAQDGRGQSAERTPRARRRGHRRGLELQHEGSRHQLSRAFRRAGADQARLGVRQSLHDAGRGL